MYGKYQKIQKSTSGFFFFFFISLCPARSHSPLHFFVLFHKISFTTAAVCFMPSYTKKKEEKFPPHTSNVSANVPRERMATS
jgi:hypothetical protein